MIIKKLDKKDEHALNKLSNFIDNAFWEHPDLKEQMYSSICARFHKDLFTVQNDEHIIVVASTHKSSWHPNCIYVQLAYNLHGVDEKFIQFMINELENNYDQPLFFLLDDRLNELSELLIRNQFEMIRKTEIIHIEPSLPIAEAVQDLRILSIKEIRTDEAKMNLFIQLCKKTYTETHIDNPVANLPIESWENAVLDGLLEEHSYVIVNGLEITAFSLMYAYDEKVWELGWVGVEDRSRVSDLDMLVHKQLRDAKEHNISFIEKEVDSTCPYSLHISDSVKYTVAETLYAYVK